VGAVTILSGNLAIGFAVGLLVLGMRRALRVLRDDASRHLRLAEPR
jgi:hypothetical protein